MSRPKGLPKTGGRKKGFNFARQLREQLAERKIDVVGDFLRNLEALEKPCSSASMGEFLMVQKLEAEKQGKAAELRLRFMDFIFPKPRADVIVEAKVTASATVDAPDITAVCKEMEQLARERDMWKD